MDKKKLEKALAKAEQNSLRWAARRAALPPGSSRAKVTTANAQWAIAAEYRDKLARQVAEAAAQASLDRVWAQAVAQSKDDSAYPEHPEVSE